MNDWTQNQAGNVNVSFGGNTSQPTAASGDVVKDIGTAEFMKEVLEGSKNGPVLVDFWAPWCGPCKQLGPVLEKAVIATKGKVRLMKMDIDRYPEVAGQMGIQSIPAVVAFIDGKPADAFMGAKPESEVKAFVDKIAASAGDPQQDIIEQTLAEAKQSLDDGDFTGAAQIYAQVLSADRENLDALAGLGHCYLGLDEASKARELVSATGEEEQKKQPLLGLLTAIELKEQAQNLGELSEFVDRIEANPDDFDARFDLAIGLNARGDREGAVEQLTAIIRKDREWREDGARNQLVELFEAWGPTDPATIKGRRSLSAILFS